MSLLLNWLLNPKKSLPAALLLLSAGRFQLSFGIAWQQAFTPSRLSTNANDFFHAFCIRLGLMPEIFALVMLGRISADRLES